MNFKRLAQIGGSMLFTALTLALVERIYFEPKAEAPVTLSHLPAPPRRPQEAAHAPAIENKAEEKIDPPPVTLSLAQRKNPRHPVRRAYAPVAPRKLASLEEPSPPEANATPLATPAPLEPRKAVWLWLNAAAARHNLNHSLTTGTQSKFRSQRAPILGIRVGFEVGELGLDASYDSAPGEVTSAPNAAVEGGSYHWNALRADATWRGLAENWKLRLGAQQHASPFLYPDGSAGKIYMRRARINFAALGLEWSPRLSEKNRLEARATYLHAFGAETLDRAEIELSRKPSGNLSLGWVHLASKHFRLGAYWQSEIQNYGFSYRASPGAAQSHGSQKITSHSLGVRFGWEY